MDFMAHSIATSARAALAAIRRGDVSIQELTSHFLERIAADNAAIGALRDVLADDAMASARAMDERIRAGQPLPPLGGLPLVIKENCDVAGAACSAGLAFRAKNSPLKDCEITSRLRAAGAVILGVSVSDPGAFGVRTAEVTHPADPTLTVGGSSGGSAAALAAGFCLGALGTDTGGSIRIPSACCGTVGLKPTFGTLPMDGVYPLVPSLDHVGPMARSVSDLGLLWSALGGTDPGSDRPVTSIGYDPFWLKDADYVVQDAFAAQLERLAAQGIECRTVRLPDLEEVADVHGRIFFIEGAAYHYAHFGADIRKYPASAQEWFEMALGWSVADYVAASERRVRLTRHVDRLLEDVDLLLTPTLCVTHPRRDAKKLPVSGKMLDFTMALVRHTSLFNHTGHPVLSVPMEPADPLPTPSVQVIGRRGEEALILRWTEDGRPIAD
jgi:Asp-tRNA(Asn)/Glu-tRNA(Gln) amidotransferase A subunit family amidase